MIVPNLIKEKLKKPIGLVYRDVQQLLGSAAGRRLVTIGDACTLALLGAGIKPHLAVFDFSCMRHGISAGEMARLKAEYPKPKTYENPAGTLSEKLMADAPMLLKNGGGVLIIGEEDLTALAFVLAAGDRDAVVYGQPQEGMVLLLPDAKLKKKMADLLSLAD